MNIKWNEYTWYSKFAAIIFFISVLPMWTFYLGIQYGEIRTLSEQAGKFELVLTNVVHKQSDEEIAKRFASTIKKTWFVDEVFTSPGLNNIFFYITNDGSGSHVWKYDVSKDLTFTKTGKFDVPMGSAQIFIEDLNIKNSTKTVYELRGVGFDGTKFVFYKTTQNSAPVPCDNFWLNSNLQYIDVAGQSIIKKEFVLNKEQKSMFQEKQSACRKAL